MAKQHTILVEGGPIADVFGPVSGVAFVAALLVHVSAAPTTAGTFQVQLDSAAGAPFDTVLYALDLAAGATTDLFADLNGLALQPGDGLRTTYSNPDRRTIGVTLQLR